MTAAIDVSPENGAREDRRTRGVMSMKVVSVRTALLLAITFTAGCGESPIPTSPTASPFVTQFDGLWNGALTLSASGVSGG
jgi:hypothetical protein